MICGGLIAAGALLEPDPVMALMSCTVLAIAGGYLGFFHNTPAIVYTVALAAMTGALCAARVVESHGTALAVVGFWLVLELNVVVPLAIQGVVCTLGPMWCALMTTR